MNYALWVMLLSVTVYWAAVPVLGTGPTRDLVAALAIVFAFANMGRYILPALRAFHRGGMQDNWQLLMGNVLFWSGFGSREIWVWMVRFETQTLRDVVLDGVTYPALIHRPEWMVGNPIEGFFAFWILGGGILCWFAGQRPLPGLPPPHRLYVYVVLSLLSGLVGAAGYSYLIGR